MITKRNFFGMLGIAPVVAAPAIAAVTRPALDVDGQMAAWVVRACEDHELPEWLRGRVAWSNGGVFIERIIGQGGYFAADGDLVVRDDQRLAVLAKLQ